MATYTSKGREEGWERRAREEGERRGEGKERGQKGKKGMGKEGREGPQATAEPGPLTALLCHCTVLAANGVDAKPK